MIANCFCRVPVENFVFRLLDQIVSKLGQKIKDQDSRRREIIIDSTPQNLKFFRLDSLFIFPVLRKIQFFLLVLFDS